MQLHAFRRRGIPVFLTRKVYYIACKAHYDCIKKKLAFPVKLFFISCRVILLDQPLAILFDSECIN
ncbi:MAG: hypothetical protein CVU06_03445 [Bacteroidetes bacterium HGW-Bacteroidetes-22]|nr:MAG: hypothetical protein CVU06_03445 [Bacteroidetes bacterium HGW-Bacteroidetes-22]